MKKFFAGWMSLVATLLFTSALAYGTESNKPITAEGGSVEQTQATASSAANPAAGEQIKWQVISGGGTRGTSTSFVLSGTVGQTAVGSGTSTSYKVNQGFWQNFGGAPACTLCGDADNSGTIDISDAVFLIQYIFAGGAAPGDCNYANGLGDADGSGTVDISDAVYLIQYIFAGGPAPGCM